MGLDFSVAHSFDNVKENNSAKSSLYKFLLPLLSLPGFPSMFKLEYINFHSSTFCDGVVFWHQSKHPVQICFVYRYLNLSLLILEWLREIRIINLSTILFSFHCYRFILLVLTLVSTPDYSSH